MSCSDALASATVVAVENSFLTPWGWGRCGLPATPNPAARRPVNWPRSGCEEGVHVVAWVKSNPLLFILQDQTGIRVLAKICHARADLATNESVM